MNYSVQNTIGDTSYGRLRPKQYIDQHRAREYHSCRPVLQVERKSRSNETPCDGLAMMDRQATVIEWSPGQEQISHIPRQEALGKTIWEILAHVNVRSINGVLCKGSLSHQRIKQVLVKFFSEMIETAGTRQLDLEIGLPNDDHRQILIDVFPVQIASAWYWGTITRDVTHFRESQKFLLESEKMIGAGQMASRIVHEINNPLAGIKNSFMLLEKGIPVDFRYYHYIDRVKKEIDRIARIVYQMYDLYRPDGECVKQLHLRGVADDVITLLESRARLHQVWVELGHWEAPDPITLAEGPLRQVLFNLINNAIEASPAFGDVVVAAAATETNLTITIRDQGAGIPEALCTRVFEPFFSTKNGKAGTGMGLGLSVSRKMAESMGGSIAFTSRPGEGTTFFIILPVLSHGGKSNAN
jgi:signal transduction histidine kinase